MNYFINKEKRAIKAKKHTAEMNEKYADEIKTCVDSTKRYTPKSVFKKTDGNKPEFIFENTDSVSAVLNSSDGKTAVLNFASYKNPGGMFYDGSCAQEESLCHESFLYNVLVKFKDTYYSEHKKTLNRALYTNEALYSPDVIFEREENVKKADVITCAAPNKKAAQEYQKVTDEENRKVLIDRIKFIKNIAEDNNVETLILGAFGGGVFRQDGKEVAEIMADVFGKTSVKKVIFAVIGDLSKDKNAIAFKRMVDKVNS